MLYIHFKVFVGYYLKPWVNNYYLVIKYELMAYMKF